MAPHPQAAPASTSSTSNLSNGGSASNSGLNESREEAFADAEPPPAYEFVAQHGSQTLEANFARPYEVQDSGAFAAPAGPPPAGHPSSRINQQHNTGGSSSSSSATGGGVFAQPPGPPPPSSSSANNNHRLSAPQLPPRHPSSSSATSSSHQPTNGPHQPHVDGVSTFNRPALPNQQPAHVEQPSQPARYAPSAHPMSGQPLLHKGKLLIYPLGIVCQKCHNTGYKDYNPENPHSKCWDKYGKNYTSAVWNAPNFNFGNSTLQKPLPNVRYAPSVASPPPPPPPQPPQQHPGYYRAGQSAPHPPQMHMQSPPPGPPLHNMMQPPMSPYQPQGGGYYGPPMHQQPQMPYISGMNYGMPPPGALIVRPGDPRIGGRLCMHCGGDGLVECGFLLLDTETCRVCNGTGRVFW